MPGKVAIVDIGSNTVRLVVYDAPLRLPIPIFNEKAQCELGRGMEKTGRLNPDGVTLAYQSLARFISLSRAMGVDHLEMVATAAVRDATDGPQFVAEIKRRFDLDVEVLSGDEEARMAALGLLCGVHDADGLVGDLGGGSLDLVMLNKGQFGEQGTLPLGHLRLAEIGDGGLKKLRGIIKEHLQGVDWIKQARGRTFYAIGGSWRVLARILIDQTHHPLHVIDNFSIRASEARSMTRVLSGLSHGSIEKISGVPWRRMETLPYAALMMEQILKTVEPETLVFSGFGMREGRMLESLPDEMRLQDPLISACAGMAERVGRFAIRGDEVADWMAPLFSGESEAEHRLRLAACLLGDIGWSEHPDYRAEHSFHRVLRVPFAGLTHRDRVLIADVIYVRYNGEPDSRLVEPVRSLLDEGQMAWVRSVGLALRLAHTISGSAPDVLSGTRLRIDANKLFLDLPPESAVYVSETVGRRLKSLARSIGLKGRFGSV